MHRGDFLIAVALYVVQGQDSALSFGEEVHGCVDCFFEVGLVVRRSRGQVGDYGVFVQGFVSAVVSKAVDESALSHGHEEAFALVEFNLFVPFPEGGEGFLHGVVAASLVPAAVHGKAEEVVGPEVYGSVVLVSRQSVGSCSTILLKYFTFHFSLFTLHISHFTFHILLFTLHSSL